MSMEQEAQQAEAQQAQQALWKAIGLRARAYCRESAAKPEQMRRLRKAAWATCGELRDLSTFLAAKYGVPPDVLFCVVVEAIGEWCRSEDFDLGAKTDASLN